MIGVRIKRAVAAAALVVWCAQPALAQGSKPASNCPSPVVEAMHMRLLQTELMVAALQCRNVPGNDFSVKYNNFIMQFGAPLTQNANVLKNHFKNQTQLDRYMTRIANDAGQRGHRPGFCQDMQPVFEQVLALKGGNELSKFSAKDPMSLGISTRDGC
ncbi:MAG: hypothetical protein FJX54_02175 [Alphaproteobacteria bacterium]|nr:hypothetical protein [Alphaproteobacteria bacterium]